MGNLDFSANADQLKELATYMASQINVPTIGIGGGYAPIGTIISVMGTTAPQDYLACDGTVYNIADYPQLADYFESQFGESNHFGGNGTTTFAVPNLQGEFLRGTGTNSHANQGSGANVGVHQDGTNIPHVIADGGGNIIYQSRPEVTLNADVYINTGTEQVRASASKLTGLSKQGVAYTSRPTNTSVLYCIKAVVAGEVYSTEERVVGTWIDSKPIYQKSVSITVPASWAYLNLGVSDADVAFIVFDASYVLNLYNSEYQYVPFGIAWSNTFGSIGTSSMLTKKPDGYLYLQGQFLNDWVGKSGVLTIRYTKTTDV